LNTAGRETQLRRISLVTDPYYFGNVFFDEGKSRKYDHAYAHMIALRAELAQRRIGIDTCDLLPPDQADGVLFTDHPGRLPPRRQGQPWFLLALESPAVRPANFEPANFAPFDRIFTYHDGIVDGGRILKVNYGFEVPDLSFPSYHDRPKLVSLFAANKFFPHANSLHGERLRLIRWFTKHLPADFDLFGNGWDDLFPHTFLQKIINRSGWRNRLRKTRFSTYRGWVDSKVACLKGYRFSICFENVADIPGYITEKIFGCFFAGTVPIYRGASNVTEAIPADCFIDWRQFSRIGELARFLQAMPPAVFHGYQARIREFLTGPRMAPFSARQFAETVAAGIAGALDRDGGPALPESKNEE